MIDKENPYQRGHRIPDFSLFSREYGQSTLEHVVRFIMQCRELANFENFYHFKLRLFPNSLTKVAFTWYTTLPRNSIQSWQQIERQFHTQFFRAKPKVCIVELSGVTQRNRETADLFISRFKKMRDRCKIHLPDTEYMKMAQRGLDIELRKKFQGMEFIDFYELETKVTEYEELLKEESYRRKKSIGTYCQEVNQEVAVTDIFATGTFTCRLLVENLMCGRRHKLLMHRFNILLR